MEEEKDIRRCHLCNGIEVNKWCVNKSCYEYTRYKEEEIIEVNENKEWL